MLSYRDRKFGKFTYFKQALSLVLTSLILVGCHRVDVPTIGDSAKRKAKQQVVDVNKVEQEKVPVDVRFSPREVTKNNVQTEAKGAWEVWPKAISVPLKIDVDMAAFNQRTFKNKPLSDAVIFIDPSHGSSLDLGSTGEVKGRTVSEAEITISLANKLKVVLENLGAKVILLRENDDWRSLHYRIAKVGAWTVDYVKPQIEKSQTDSKWLDEIADGMKDIMERNNDRQDLPKESSGLGVAWGYGVSATMRQLFDLESQIRQVIVLSLNMSATSQLENQIKGFLAYYLNSDFIFENELQNMNGQPDTNGSFAFASNERANPAYTYKNDAERERLAESIYDAVVGKITHFARNAETGKQVGPANFTILRETGYASAALQCGFISDEGDLSWILDEDNQNNLAQAIGKGIYNYYCTANWPLIDGLSHSNDKNWKSASDAYREKKSGVQNQAPVKASEAMPTSSESEPTSTEKSA